MNNLEKYNTVFTKIFNVTEESLGTDFTSEKVGNWDSITQLSLVTALEDEFDVLFDTTDILDMKSYEIGKQLLAKYDIAL